MPPSSVDCGYFFFLPESKILTMAILPLLLLLFKSSPAMTSTLPEFLAPVSNVTVPVGREAVLSCVVDHLGKHKVAWIKVDTQTILTIHHHVITRNYRIFLSHSDHKYWYLHINNVQESDRGFYMCQVNTVPMRSIQGYLEVAVSPNILDNETSSDLVVKEGASVSLVCRASGYPKPLIKWQREDNNMISLNSNQDVQTFEGEVLNISRVSRLHMGAYLCIAKNGILPSVSKRIVLKVHFPPMIWIPHQRMAGMINTNITLECNTEAYPKSINYWTTESGEMISSGDKYTVIAVESSYQMHMRLKIHYLNFEDFGLYRCIAKNSLGETSGTIKLLEVSLATPIVVTSTDKINFESKGHLSENKLKLLYNSSESNSINFIHSKDQKMSETGHLSEVTVRPTVQFDKEYNCSSKGLSQILTKIIFFICFLHWSVG